jgi:hypothetical protein
MSEWYEKLDFEHCENEFVQSYGVSKTNGDYLV